MCTTKLNPQSRDIIKGMVEADSIPDECNLCGCSLEGNAYSPFATVCRNCADEVEQNND